MDTETTPRDGVPRPATSGKARFCGKSDEWVMATDGRRSTAKLSARAFPHVF
ncbi:hypothetical protein M407DRAFT_25290 [Tulasnella calospora MUT 4182]|uniref:Uncharacterized protein n=1 Tax=Tulasnella calospora MUT 4182 TaxID=1051891 RepID=A0A0C3QHV2_9AGAM|nr:hypothetical protein M407DRAFT_25290 [Tulasnella calospora MUT 4182]